MTSHDLEVKRSGSATRRALDDDVPVHAGTGEDLPILQDLVRAVADGILVVDRDGIIRYETPLARRLFGMTESLIGQRFGYPIVVDETTDIEIHRGDAGIRTVEMRVVATEWYGEPAVAVGLHDATARREMGARLREREAWLQALVDNALDAILVADDHGRYVAANPAAEELFGTTREAILGASFHNFTPDEEPEGYRPLWRRFLDDGVQEGIIRIRRPDGEIREAEYRARAGFLPGLHVSFLRDVTGRAALEEQLRQAQKMEAVGRLAGGVAHDFNNLLTAILGNCTLIAEEVPPDTPIAEAVEEIRHAGERAAALTRRLLLFSRRQAYRPEVLDLNAVVRGVDPMLRRLLTSAIDVVVDLVDEPVFVEADVVRLEQVMMNLVVNARDAMPGGGRLTLRTSMHGADDAQVMLEVRDSGVGMTADVVERACEPFFTTKDVGKGTGLGLATVYSIVQDLGGTLRIESEVGRGTAVFVALPRAASVPDQAASVATAPPSGGETILVVEDEAPVRRLAVSMLTRLGYTVIEAHDGPSALAAEADHDGPIALVLSDIIMPGLSGRQVARRLRERRPGLPVLFMSGYADGASDHPDMADVAGDILPKPFTLHALAERVRETLASSAPNAG